MPHKRAHRAALPRRPRPHGRQGQPFQHQRDRMASSPLALARRAGDRVARRGEVRASPAPSRHALPAAEPAGDELRPRRCPRWRCQRCAQPRQPRQGARLPAARPADHGPRRAARAPRRRRRARFLPTRTMETRMTHFHAGRRAVVAALLASCAATGAFAQAKYPDHPITFVVPFAAGSATDQLARALGASISADTKQAVVVDNKAGASGMMAAQAAARAAADGYTVLITTNTTHAANEHLYKKLPYDPVKDFVPVTGLGKGGQVLVVRADSPYKSVADLLAKAKKEPGKLSFGSGSSSSRVAGEMFKQLSGTEILHVPYKSNPQALTDLLGGQIDMMITDTATGVPQIKGGKLKALGVSTTKRIALLPDVPTIDEAGVKGYDMGYWFAAYVPANTPAPVVARLHDLLVAGTKSAAAKAFYESSGGDAWTTSSAELAKFQAGEAAKWSRVIKAAG